MVAAGSNIGTVTIFQVPKAPPESLPDSLKKSINRQVRQDKAKLSVKRHFIVRRFRNINP